MADTHTSTVPNEPSSERTRVRRISEKGAYDRATIDAILDEGLVAHVGFVGDGAVGEAGTPFVIPTAYCRDGDRLLFHGSAASRMLRAGFAGIPVCVSVTLLDGMVVARSLFESSMAYRSVVVLGVTEAIDEPEEKLAALLTISDRLIPGRVEEARSPTTKEVAATKVFALSLDEASAKVSDTSVEDVPEDLSLPIWAGHIPLRFVSDPPIAEPDVPATVPLPSSVATWTPERGR